MRRGGEGVGREGVGAGDVHTEDGGLMRGRWRVRYPGPCYRVRADGQKGELTTPVADRTDQQKDVTCALARVSCVGSLQSVPMVRT